MDNPTESEHDHAGVSAESSADGGADRNESPAGSPDTKAVGRADKAPGRADNGHQETGQRDQGHPEPVTARLPPPWERVPTAGSGADEVDDRLDAGDHGDADLRADRRADFSAGRERRDFDDLDDFGELEDLGDEPAPASRGVSPELAEARTVGVAARGGAARSGGVDGPPSGFGSAAGRAGLGSLGPVGSAAPSGGAWVRNRRPRQANLQLKRFDPWSVLKIALVLSVVLYLVWMVAVGVLYGALDGIGVWDRLNGQYADLVSEHAGEKLISGFRVFGFAAVVGAVNSLLVAVAFSVSAFIYNVSADLVGGIEVTLSERD